ncbi:MAG: protease [Lysobacteraceae bacterium]|nr:MAG: protease [Xanthomonadaceae bacterium]
MSTSNVVVRLFEGLWTIIDGTRRVVLNLLFLFIVAIIFAAMMSDQSIVVKEKTALVLAPNGIIVDEYSREPVDIALDRALDRELPETRLRDVIRAIDRAREDDRISHLVLHPDTIWSVGLASLLEIGASIEAFKGSGKPVIAMSDGMGQHQYYLASIADEVWMHPEGVVFLEGYDRYRNYYKSGLDMLGVDVHLFRVGEYKSAAEPYIRDSMSEQSREANLYWLGDLWSTFTDHVEAHRELPKGRVQMLAERFDQELADAGGDLAKLAVNAGLVDQLMTRDQMRKALMDMGVASEPKSETFRQIDIDTYLSAVGPGEYSSNRIAVVVAQGAIVYGDQPAGVVGGESTARLLERARRDDKVKAVVLRVNSPGGAVFPSEQIRHQVELTRSAGKPVVVSMGDVAASGGYWISMSADAIYANPATITGSIGIFGLMLTFPDTLEKIGVHTDGIGTTPLAGAFRADRKLPEEAGKIIQQVIDNGYEQFLTRVAESRQMSVEAVDEVARGRVWSGQQAYDRGLIDELGTMADAVNKAAELADIEQYELRWIEREVTSFERFLLDMTASVLAGVGLDQHLGGLSLWPGARDVIDELRVLFADHKINTMYAHCMCQLGGR